MDFELTEEQRAFAQPPATLPWPLAPHAPVGRRGHLPKEAIAKAGELGFLRPVRAGSRRRPALPGSTPRWCLKKWRRLTPAPPPSSPSTTWRPGCWAPGPRPAVRDQWGEAAHHRQKLASYCLTDPARAPDAASLKDPRRAGGQRIRHQRQQGLHQRRRQHRCAGADGPHGRRASGASGISAFAVPADAPGITYGKKEEKDGLEQPAHPHHQL